MGLGERTVGELEEVRTLREAAADQGEGRRQGGVDVDVASSVWVGPGKLNDPVPVRPALVRPARARGWLAARGMAMHAGECRFIRLVVDAAGEGVRQGHELGRKRREMVRRRR